MLAVGSALVALSAKAAGSNAAAAASAHNAIAEVAGPIAVLAGAYLASVGWMYTRFEQDKADRAKATLDTIREHMYGEAISSAYSKMATMTRYYQRAHDWPAKHPLPLAAMQTRLEETDLRLRFMREGKIKLDDAATQYFNALNQLALGVRLGQLELATIRLVLRPRFVRPAERFCYFIVQKTQAKWDEEIGRYRSQTRTLEHFLWLLSHLEVLSVDKVEYRYLVMPPDHIVGKRETEIVRAPKHVKGAAIPEPDLANPRA